jgi:hypothetical protein
MPTMALADSDRLSPVFAMLITPDELVNVWFPERR